MSPHPSLYVKRGPEYRVLLANPPLCMIITHVRLSCFDSPIKTEINTVYKINTKIHECLHGIDGIYPSRVEKISLSFDIFLNTRNKFHLFFCGPVSML